MARSKPNHLNVQGKLGNTVTYLLNGKWVTRTIGISTKAPSIPQLSVRQAAKVTSEFLNPLLPFIGIGFRSAAKAAKLYPQALAFAYNRKNALRGVYPDYRIDFSSVLLSMGKMPITAGPMVTTSNKGLLYTWDTEDKIDGIHWSDHVLLVAYFPQSKRAIYLLGGARRYQGSAELPLFGIKHGQAAETYLAFAADDYSSMSNSVYLGQVAW